MFGWKVNILPKMHIVQWRSLMYLAIFRVKMMRQRETVIMMMTGKNLQVLYEVTASGVHTSCTVIAIFLRWWCCSTRFADGLDLEFFKDENEQNTQRLYWPRILQVLHELTGTDELYVDCEVVNRDDHCLVVESWWSLWSGQYWWSLCQYYSGHHGWDYFIMYWIFLLSFPSALLNSSW